MKRLILVLVLAVGPMWHLSVARAATITYKGLSISPSIEQLVLQPGQAQANYQIRLDNNQASPMNIQITTIDFKSLSDAGGVAFITDPTAAQHKYGLANWISTPVASLSLPANGGQFVPITIDNRTDLSPGGHYAAVLFKVVSPGGNANHVQVDQVVSSLVFVRKTGGEIYGLNLIKNTVHRNFAWFGWPSRIDDDFYNSGNVQTAPRGVITLSGTNTVLNPNSSLVLPESTRLIGTDLGSIKAPFWPGIYHIKLSYRPDGSSKFTTLSPNFVYVSWRFLTAFALLVSALLTGLPRRGRKAVWQFSQKTSRRIFVRLKWLIVRLAKLVWKVLIYIDTLLGRWLDRRSRKARK